MATEVPGKESGYAPSEAELLETLFLTTLEEHDGLCLDNEPERLQLAAVLTQALTSTARNSTINPIFLNEGQEAEGTS